MKITRVALLFSMMVAVYGISTAVESGMCRLLSVSDSSKLILISQLPSKTKYILDAGTARITVNGKPAEFQDLKSFSVLQVKMELRKFSKDGISIDGVATEIHITIPDKP